jgi:hypothetical protein
MILRGVLVALGFAAGMGLLIWRIVKTEASILQDVEHEFVQLKTYPADDNSYTMDDMLLRANHILTLTRKYGGARGGVYWAICVPREQLEQAREVLAKATPA